MIRITKHILLGAAAFCCGYLLIWLGVHTWTFLGETIVGPETRWGPDWSRRIGEALEPIAYLVVVLAMSLSLVLLSPRLALRYSAVVSLGALVNFGTMLVITSAQEMNTLAIVRTMALGYLVVLLGVPIVTFGVLRTGWLARRSPAASG